MLDWSSNQRGVFSSKIAGINARLEGSAMGSAIRRGTMETFGWEFKGGINQGFLGLGENIQRTKRSMSMASKFGQNQYKAGAKAFGRSIKGVGVGGMLGKLAGPAFSAAFIYSAYKEEGVWGAAKETATWAGFNIAQNYLLGAAGGVGLGITAAAAVGYGAYKFGEASIAHRKGLRNLEMSGGDLNAVESMGAQTMRQKSLMAINNSHLNARSALGNEAYLTHRTFM